MTRERWEQILFAHIPDEVVRDMLNAYVLELEAVLEFEAANAKLRELVRDMMRFFENGDYCDACEKAAECEEPEIYESDCLMRHVFKDRMRELGVEVDG